MNPLDAGMGWTVDMKTERDFIGRDALDNKRANRGISSAKLLDKGVMFAHVKCSRRQAGRNHQRLLFTDARCVDPHWRVCRWR